MVDQQEKARRYDVWQAWTEGREIAVRPVIYPNQAWFVFSCKTDSHNPGWDWDRFDYRMAEDVGCSSETSVKPQ